MSDLISRSALIEAMEKKYEVAEKKGLYAVGLDCGFIITEQIIKEQPTVEAKPVVHGKWEQRTEWDEDNNAIFECTNCRHGDVQAKGAEVPYCWYCGADMRKKVE